MPWLTTRSPLAALPILIAIGSQPAAGQSIPVSLSQHGVGNNPRSVALGDLNADGRPDVVTANFGTHDVTVLLANASGAYAAATSFLVGTNPVAVALGDFNGDGRLDLATANAASGNVSIRLGNGAGGFGALTNIAMAAAPQSVAIDDLNGDSKADLVVTVAFLATNKVSVLLGNGAGGFGAATSFNVGLYPASVVIGDLNLDGKRDLVTANLNANTVSVLLGNGLGGFGAATSFPIAAGALVGTGPRSLAIGDVNGDAKPDVLTANSGSDNVSILVGNGAGGLSAAITWALPGASPRSIVLGDLNRDGMLDFATANYAANSVSFVPGVFSAPQNIDLGPGTGPMAIALGDLNGDGLMDALAADSGTGNVSRILQTPPLGFVAMGPFPCVGPRSLALGDLDGDGDLDVVAARNQGAQEVHGMLGDGFGSLSAPTSVPVPAVGGPTTAGVKDLNGDGKPDVATVNDSANSVSVFLGTGGGSLGGATTYAVGTGPHDLAIEDANNDGTQDIVTANLQNANNYLSILKGNGSGGFTVGSSLVGGPSGHWAIALANMDGAATSRIDAVTVNPAPANMVQVHSGTVDGLFGQVGVAVGTGPQAVALEDWDADGDIDVATVNNSGAFTASVSVLRNSGFGSLGSLMSFSAPAGSWGGAGGDLNGDGKPDVVGGNNAANLVAVLLGNGIGGFATPVTFATLGGGPPLAVAIGDMTGDGRPDVVTAHPFNDKVTILRNSPVGTYGLALYGAGSPGCAGALSMSANGPPKVNTPGFAYTCTNAPPNSLGLGLATDAKDFAGSDPFGLGVDLHVNFFAATEVYALDFFSDAVGAGIAHAPLPNDPALAGKTYFLQSLWIEEPARSCSPSPFGLVSSKGVAVTIQM
jgi:VCBS repeat protein